MNAVHAKFIGEVSSIVTGSHLSYAECTRNLKWTAPKTKMIVEGGFPISFRRKDINHVDGEIYRQT